MMNLVGLILLLMDGKYLDAFNIFILFLVSLGITLLLTRYIEKNAYKAEQKNYAIVTVSDKGSHSHELAEEEEVFVHPFEKEEDAFFATGKVSSTFMFTLTEWNEKKGVAAITQDPTFLVISDNGNANVKKAMTKPFVIASDSEEVLQFLG